MIENHIAEAFYLVSVRGEAIKSFFDGDFGIDAIHICSDMFPNDLVAGTALGDVISHIASDEAVDISDAQEDVDLNPDFFPSIDPIAMTDEMMEMQDREIARIKMENDIPNDSIPIVMTKKFDEYGDFVVARWHIKSETMDVMARVGIMPSKYMYLKSITDDDPMLIEHRENSGCKKTLLQ